MNISLHVPSLVLLIGISGSGKSTFARQHFAPTEVVSSDHCRALVCDDENNQAVNQEAFELVHLIATKRLAHHKLTVIDATNVEAVARQPLLDVAKAYSVPVIAIVLNLDETLCCTRDAARSHRNVGAEIIQQQSDRLRLSLTELPGEGFVSIYQLHTSDEIAAVTITRT